MESLVLVSLSLALFWCAQLRESCASGAAGATAVTRFELEYTLIMVNSPDCPSFQAYPAPELQYRQAADSEWTTLTSKILLFHHIKPISTLIMIVDVLLHTGRHTAGESHKFHYLQESSC